MTDEISVTREALIDIRIQLIQLILKGFTENEKKFLVSLKTGRPDWTLMPIQGIEKLPAILWKLENIRKIPESKKEASLDNLKENNDRTYIPFKVEQYSLGQQCTLTSPYFYCITTLHLFNFKERRMDSRPPKVNTDQSGHVAFFSKTQDAAPASKTPESKPFELSMNISRKVYLKTLTTNQLISHYKDRDQYQHRAEDVKYIPYYYCSLNSEKRDRFFYNILNLLTENDHNLTYQICNMLLTLSTLVTQENKNDMYFMVRPLHENQLSDPIVQSLAGRIMENVINASPCLTTHAVDEQPTLRM